MSTVLLELPTHPSPPTLLGDPAGVSALCTVLIRRLKIALLLFDHVFMPLPASLMHPAASALHAQDGFPHTDPLVNSDVAHVRRALARLYEERSLLLAAFGDSDRASAIASTANAIVTQRRLSAIAADHVRNAATHLRTFVPGHAIIFPYTNVRFREHQRDRFCEQFKLLQLMYANSDVVLERLFLSLYQYCLSCDEISLQRMLDIVRQHGESVVLSSQELISYVSQEYIITGMYLWRDELSDADKPEALGSLGEYADKSNRLRVLSGPEHRSSPPSSVAYTSHSTRSICDQIDYVSLDDIRALRDTEAATTFRTLYSQYNARRRRSPSAKLQDSYIALATQMTYVSGRRIPEVDPRETPDIFAAGAEEIATRTRMPMLTSPTWVGPTANALGVLIRVVTRPIGHAAVRRRHMRRWARHEIENLASFKHEYAFDIIG
jgi:hypothetical protein